MVTRLKIKEIAQQKGIGMEKLSRLADVNKKTVQKIWNNPYTSITLYTLSKLASALEVKTTDLIEDE